MSTKIKQPAAKKSYSKPILKAHGKLKNLTAGGTGTMTEQGSNMQASKQML